MPGTPKTPKQEEGDAAAPSPSARLPRTISASLHAEQAILAFVEAMPAVACLSKERVALTDESEDPAAATEAAEASCLRHMQEWLARCGEFKYAQIDAVHLSERTSAMLRNVFNGVGADTILADALLPPPAPRFDAAAWVPWEGGKPPAQPEASNLAALSGLDLGELTKPLHALLLRSWPALDLSGVPGFGTAGGEGAQYLVCNSPPLPADAQCETHPVRVTDNANNPAGASSLTAEGVGFAYYGGEYSWIGGSEDGRSTPSLTGESTSLYEDPAAWTGDDTTRRLGESLLTSDDERSIYAPDRTGGPGRPIQL